MTKEFEEKILAGLQKINEIDEIKKKLSKIDEIEKKISKIDEIEKKVSRIDLIESRLDKLEQNFESLNRSIILIEDAVTNKIPALFDGYSLNYELEKKNEKDVENLKHENFTNSIKIANLEKITDEHSKKIKQLIS